MDNMNMNGASMNGFVGANGMPPVQPTQSMASQYQATGMPVVGASGQPMVQQVPASAMPKKDNSGLIKTIVIIILSLVAVTFIGLFVWMMMNYQEAQTDLDTKIAVAVHEAEEKQAVKMEAEFAEREKHDYRTFSGPADYGQLTFDYPKTWSVYVEEAATGSEGDFRAYFNPIQVNAVSEDTVNALRLTIRDESFDKVVQRYQEAMEEEESNLTMTSTTIGRNNDITANYYTGTIPDTEFSGLIVIFKIRDKAVIMQTDSTLFKGDFNNILSTITFKE